MYEAEANYLKRMIRVKGVLKWLFPKNLKVVIRESSSFHTDSPYRIYIEIWFAVEKRIFRVAIHSSKRFENIREIPEAFLKAYERAIKRIERGK